MRTVSVPRYGLVLGVIAALTVPTLGVAAAIARPIDPSPTHARRTWTPPRGHHTTTTSSSTSSTTTSTTSSSTSSSTTSATSTSSTTSKTSTTSSTTSSTTTPSGTMPTPTGVVYADHVAQWNVLCTADHYAKDDPIVFPGSPGASHMHTFYANRSTNAYTTLASLSASSPSSCGRGMGTSDLSAYWVPSLMKKNADGTTSVYQGEQTNVVYYRRAGGGRGPGVLPFPKGLRMIAGNAKATSDQSLSVVQWDCGGGGVESPHMYQCPADPSHEIHASLVFPSCWDGVHLDSADHKSHMAYAGANGACPADHPVSLPEITFEVDFPGVYGGPDWSLASGGIYSLHGDFFADWDNQVQNALVSACLNNPHECGDINRSGTTLFRPDYDPEPITIDMTKYPTTSPWDGRNLQQPTPTTSSTTMTMSGMGH